MADIKTPPKKLVDLNPKWVTNREGDIYGVGYDCPCGLPVFEPKYAEDGTFSVGADGKVVGVIPYDQCCPRGGREVVPTKSNFLGMPMCSDSLAHGWTLTGTSFGDVSLQPSIHAIGHWHGFLTNGVLVSC